MILDAGADVNGLGVKIKKLNQISIGVWTSVCKNTHVTCPNNLRSRFN